MAQMTKQRVLDLAVTLAAGMLSNVSNGVLSGGSWQISNTLQDCVNAVGQMAESLGYQIVLEHDYKPIHYCAISPYVEPTDDSDDTANDKGEKE